MDTETYPPNSNPPYAPYSPTGLQPDIPTQDFFRFRIESMDIIEEMQHQLRGEAQIGSNKWARKFEPWCNEDGVNKITHVVYSCGINKNIFLGNLTHEEICFKCNLIKRKMAKLLFHNYISYGIKKEMRDLLIATVINTIHSGLSRCENGKEAEHISVAAQRHEIYHEGLNKNQGSKINPLNWFR